MSTSIVTIQDNKQEDLLEEEYEIKSGEYWLNTNTNRIRLIKSLTIIDGILHSITVAQHPSDRKTSKNSGVYVASDYTTDEFFSLYKPINQEEANNRRKEEISELQKEIQNISSELSLGYIKEDGTLVNELLTNIKEKTQNDMNLPISLAKENKISNVKNNIEEIRAITELQAQFIKEKTELISFKTDTLATFFQEKAEQSLASIDGTIKVIGKLEKAVHTLDIFCGDGVEVYQLSKGAEANKKEPIHLYQRKLFLDEEFFYNLADGGADFRSVEAFKEALKNDFSIIDRMLPTQKSIVLMQFRRNEKENRFHSEYKITLAEAMEKMFEREQNEKRFLLVRNGFNVYMIMSDDLSAGKRLFPTSEELNDIFKTNGTTYFDGVEIDKKLNFNDLENARARSKFDNKSLYYKRVLVMLYGLHERKKEIFGKLVDETKQDWFSLEFQRANFKFIHDDEDGIDYKSESLADYVKRHNKNIQIGSRIIGVWYKIMNEDNASGLYSYSVYGESNKIWFPEPIKEPLVVQGSKGELFVTVKCNHQFDDSKTKNIKCFLKENDPYWNGNSLVIDDVKSKDITYFLNSRKHRTNYVSFAQLLIDTRALLKKEEEESRELISEIKDYLVNLYKSLSEKDVENKLFESISFWRKKNKGATLPNIKLSSNIKFRNDIVSIFHNKTLGDSLSLVESFINKNIEEELINLSTNHNGTYYVYTVIPVKERREFGLEDESLYPFVNRTIITIKNTNIKIKETSQVTYKNKYIKEEIVKKFRDYKIDSIDRQIPVDYLKKVDKLIDNQKKSSKLMRILMDEKEESSEIRDAFLLELFNDKKERQNDKGRGYILDYSVSFWAEIYFAFRIDSKKESHRAKNQLVILEHRASLNALIARYGNDSLYSSLVDWVLSRHRKPNDELDMLSTIREYKKDIFALDFTTIYFYNQFKISKIESFKENNDIGYFKNNHCIRNTSIGILSENTLDVNYDEYVDEKLNYSSFSEEKSKFYDFVRLS